MFALRRPSDAAIARLLAEQASRPLSYAAVGATRGDRAPTLPRNHHRTRLGAGECTYAAAVAAMHRWAMYDLPWTEVYPPAPPVAPGTVFAAVVRHLGFWSVNPCRVVYVESRDGDVATSTFAIGTLPGHAEQGEERFTVEWHRADDAVWFEILAHAGARHPLARLGWPIVRMLQRRFGVEAMGAMRGAIRGAGL